MTTLLKSQFPTFIDIEIVYSALWLMTYSQLRLLFPREATLQSTAISSTAWTHHGIESTSFPLCSKFNKNASLILFEGTVNQLYRFPRECFPKYNNIKLVKSRAYCYLSSKSSFIASPLFFFISYTSFPITILRVTLVWHLNCESFRKYNRILLAKHYRIKHCSKVRHYVYLLNYVCHKITSDFLPDEDQSKVIIFETNLVNFVIQLGEYSFVNMLTP